MKIDDLNECFESVKLSDSRKEKMLYNILSAKNGRLSNFVILKSCCGVMAAVICMVGIRFVYTKLGGSNDFSGTVASNVGEIEDVRVSNEAVVDSSSNIVEKSSENAKSGVKSKKVPSVKRKDSSYQQQYKADKDVAKEDKTQKGEKLIEESIVIAQAQPEATDVPMVARGVMQKEETEGTLSAQSESGAAYAGGASEVASDAECNKTEENEQENIEENDNKDEDINKVGTDEEEEQDKEITEAEKDIEK